MLDSAFDKDGMATAYIGYKNDYLNDVAVQADGKIVGVGIDGGAFGRRDISVIKLNEDGSLDKDFNSIGSKTIKTLTAGSTAYSVALQQNKKIVIGPAA